MQGIKPGDLLPERIPIYDDIDDEMNKDVDRQLFGAPETLPPDPAELNATKAKTNGDADTDNKSRQNPPPHSYHTSAYGDTYSQPQQTYANPSATSKIYHYTKSIVPV